VHRPSIVYNVRGERRARWWRTVAKASRSPLAWITVGLLVLRAIGIGWGLPASDGWDNDGVAPRDFLAGLVETVTPGHYATYPPVHLALLAVVTAPVTAVALARAPSLAAPDVVHEILKVPYMTAIAYGARAVTLAMSLGLVWLLAKVTEELRGKSAGWCAAAFAGVNVPLTYYSHTSNLDVPYLFWALLAVLALVRAAARREPRRLRAWALFAALAVGTKDQAYALFVLAMPAALVLWLCIDPWARSAARLVLREAAVAGAILVGMVLLVDGAFFNPTGFRERIRFLLGPASGPFAQYTNDWAGRWEVVRDLAARFATFYPWAFALLAAAGLALLVRVERRAPARFVAALVPCLAAASFTIAFNCVARRTDHRFGLPQALLAAVYGGVALDAVLFRARSLPVRAVSGVLAAAAFAVALFDAAAVDANLLRDPRYAAEAWLRGRARQGDTIETYGLNVYMPHFPPGLRVLRVGPAASDHRSPMPGVDEVVAAYDSAAERGARFIVVSAGWAWRYLLDPGVFRTEGYQLPPTQAATVTDQRAHDYFAALTRGQYGAYRLAYVASFQSKVWPALELHGATSREIWIYERLP
jgi:4-amino-4-deoxy-L-arabinose transferase-like glycosyltransferase